MPIRYFMKAKDLITFRRNDYIDDIRETMAQKRYRDFPIMDLNGRYYGMISRRSLLGARKKQLVLVDHNEIMQKTDYSLPDSLGILMTFKYDNVNLMDFDRFDELHDIGYNRTIQLMDSIKARISRRINYRQLELKRIAYKKNMPELRFREISITGGNEQQKKYIRKEFHSSDHEIFSLEDLRKGYFRLMSDNMISEIIPHAVYNKVDTTFTLHLKVKIEDDLSLRVGGNVGSNGANQIYVGATYHNLNNFSKEVSLDGQLGQIYNNLQIAGRIDFPTHIPTSFRLVGSISSFDYFKQEKLFSKGNSPVFNKKKENFVKLLVSMPFLTP